MGLTMRNVPQWTCAQCGEQVEGKLASCWNCGAGKDGSPPQDRPEFNFMKKTRNVPPATSFDAASSPLSTDHKHAFDMLYESYELEELLHHRPSGTRSTAWSTFWMSLGLVLVTLGIVGKSDSEAAAALIVLGAYPVIAGTYDLLKFRFAPLKCMPAIVVYKSKQVSAEYTEGDGGNAVLIACIETRDGHKQEYKVGLELFDKIQQEDIGVAYIRGGHMLDFKKVKLDETQITKKRL